MNYLQATESLPTGINRIDVDLQFTVLLEKEIVSLDLHCRMKEAFTSWKSL